MTLNDLIREAQKAAMNFSSGDIPITIKAKEVDIDFYLVSDGERYFAEMYINKKAKNDTQRNARVRAETSRSRI